MSENIENSRNIKKYSNKLTDLARNPHPDGSVFRYEVEWWPPDIIAITKVGVNERGEPFYKNRGIIVLPRQKVVVFKPGLPPDPLEWSITLEYEDHHDLTKKMLSFLYLL